MQTRTKVIVGVGVVAVLLAAAALSSGTRRARGVPVRSETVQERDLVAVVTASGNVRARRKVDISSDISARVTELMVNEGEDVTEGQILLRLDPSRYQASLDRSRASLSQAEAQVAQANANFLQAQREAERMASFWARDSLLVSRQDVESAETTLEVQRSLLRSAEFGVNQARAAVEEAADLVSKTVIEAPMSGRVTRLNVEEGETVIVGTMNNPGSLVLTVSDLSVMEVVLEVDETDVPEIELGDSAVVELDAFPEVNFPGTVTEIGNSAIRDPSAAAGSGQTPTIDFEVVVTLENPPGQLRPDLSATAEVITATRTDQPSIPIIALTVREEDDLVQNDESDSAGSLAEGESAEDADANRQGDSDEPIEGVLVIREGKVTFTPVTVGIAGQEYFEVLSGVSLGDSVVSGPYQVIRTLRDGAMVRLMADTTNDANDNSES